MKFLPQKYGKRILLANKCSIDVQIQYFLCQNKKNIFFLSTLNDTVNDTNSYYYFLANMIREFDQILRRLIAQQR